MLAKTALGWIRHTQAFQGTKSGLEQHALSCTSPFVSDCIKLEHSLPLSEGNVVIVHNAYCSTPRLPLVHTRTSGWGLEQYHKAGSDEERKHVMMDFGNGLECSHRSQTVAAPHISHSLCSTKRTLTL